MSLSFKTDCREAIEYLYRRKQALEEAPEWDENKAEEYEDLESYCRAIHGALEHIEYFEEREAILIDRYGKEAIDDAGKAWLTLKMAKTNELFDLTPEAYSAWEGDEDDEPD